MVSSFPVFVIWGVGLAVASERSEQEPADPKSEQAALAGFADLMAPLAGFEWDEEAARVRRAADSLWKRNGWTDEADEFAREVACEVTAIPPWDLAGRLSLLTTRIAERYGLPEEAASRFRTSLMREAGGFFMRNGRAILEHGREALTARARGEPYTPEQVAKWAKVLEPLLVDMRVSVDRLAKEVEPSLDAGHKLLMDRDLQSIQKRTRYMDAMQARWAEGRWQPTDWGLEADPIQSRAVPAGGSVAPAATPIQVAASPESAPRAPPPKCVPYDPATWFACVVEFEKRFQLDAGQRSTADSIHAEVVERAGDYAKTHREELRMVSPQERGTDPAYEPIRALFTELHARLDALPTTAQRETHKP